MKILGIFLILSCYNPVLLLAQSSETDSLLNLLNSVDDRDKANIYYQLSMNTIWSWPDSTVDFAEKGLEFANRYEQVEEKLNLLFALSTGLTEKGNFSMGLERAYERLALAETLSNPYYIFEALSGIGSVHFYAKDYKSALPFFLRLKDDPEVYQGSLYLYAGFIGETYFHLGEFDSAYAYLQVSIENMHGDYKWPVPYLYMGKLYEEKGNTKKAVEYYRESMEGEVPIADYIKGYLAIGTIYKKENNLDSAIYYSKLAYDMAQNTSLAIFSLEAIELLKDSYQNLNMLDSAFAYSTLLLTEREKLYSREQMVQLQNITYDQEKRQQQLGQEKENFKRQLTFYSLLLGLLIILIVAFILYKNNLFKQRAYNLLHKQKADLDNQKAKVDQALRELKSTQSQLIHSEKMASLGELTAGIAHEIQNPLNFVKNFSEVSEELASELNEELEKGDFEEAKLISDDVAQNLQKISHHGKRASDIVKSMLEHSRTGDNKKEPTDINKLADEYLRLAYHGLRAKDKSFNADFNTDLDPALPKVTVVPQDIGRVVLNLINNAFQAVKDVPNPKVTVTTKAIPLPEGGSGAFESIKITVSDNGTGIPDDIKDKIFQPFFTTKPTGEGTGLGLSMSYDIITKGHGGSLKVKSETGKGTIFEIQLPN